MAAFYLRKLVQALAFLNSKRLKPLFFSQGIRRKIALCYHDISEPTDPNLHQVSPDKLKEQLRSLQEKGYRFVSADDFLLKKDYRLLSKIACVTFDDGYKSVLISAAPILKELNIPATLFLNGRLLKGEIFWRDKVRKILARNCVEEFQYDLNQQNQELARSIDFDEFYRSTKSNKVNSKLLEVYLDKFFEKKDCHLIDSSLYLNLNELKDLLKFEFIIGNHTFNHYRLSTLNKEEKRNEIVSNQEMLDKLNVLESSIFAFPFGENGSFNQEDITILKDQSYKGFFMTNQGQRTLNIPSINIDALGLAYSNRILPPNENIFS